MNKHQRTARVKLMCRHCGYSTTHVCLPDVQTDIPPGTYAQGDGLFYKCERCGRGEPRGISHEVVRCAERVS